MIILYITGLLSGFSDSPKALSTEHAIYVSVVEIEHGQAGTESSIMVKVFTDDLEDAIQNYSGDRVNLSTSCDKNLGQVDDYFKQHLKLTINNINITYTIQGCENVDISTWLEFSFTANNEWNNLVINGDHLMELFPTQSNVFSIKYEDQKRMFRLTNDKRSTLIEF